MATEADVLAKLQEFMPPGYKLDHWETAGGLEAIKLPENITLRQKVRFGEYIGPTERIGHIGRYTVDGFEYPLFAIIIPLSPTDLLMDHGHDNQ